MIYFGQNYFKKNLCQNGLNGSIVRRRRVIFTFKVLALSRVLRLSRILQRRLLCRVLLSLVRRWPRVLHRRVSWELHRRLCLVLCRRR